MAITPLPALDRTSPSFRTDLDSYFGSALPQFAGQANALAASLNSLAAGGAYAIPYVYGDIGSVAQPAGGKLFLGPDGAAQNAATVLYADSKDSTGSLVSTLLDTFGASTSLVKGFARVQKQGDPSRWARYSVTAMPTANTTYHAYTVSILESSHTNPFVWGDAVLLHFTPNGDKGNTGATGPAYQHPVLLVRDEKASGTGGGSPSAGTWNTRVLNTVKANTISGASLSSNRITLPAGTYEYEASAPAYGADMHRLRLYNVTDGVVTEVGGSEQASASTATRAFVTGKQLVLTAPKVFELQHFIGSNGGGNTLGVPISNTGVIEVYAEIEFRKVA